TEYNYQPYREPVLNNYYDSYKSELFYFDPNTLSEDGWKKLGVKDNTIQTIKKYTSKGGRFYKAEDISKIWGLNESMVKRLLPYIKIEQLGNPVAKHKKDDHTSYTNKPASNPANTFVDINTADSSALLSLPG